MITGALLFFALLGLSGCFITCYDRRVRNDLAQPCRELCLCCCHPGYASVAWFYEPFVFLVGFVCLILWYITMWSCTIVLRTCATFDIFSLHTWGIYASSSTCCLFVILSIFCDLFADLRSLLILTCHLSIQVLQGYHQELLLSVFLLSMQYTDGLWLVGAISYWFCRLFNFCFAAFLSFKNFLVDCVNTFLGFHIFRIPYP